MVVLQWPQKALVLAPDANLGPVIWQHSISGVLIPLKPLGDKQPSLSRKTQKPNRLKLKS